MTKPRASPRSGDPGPGRPPETHCQRSARAFGGDVCPLPFPVVFGGPGRLRTCRCAPASSLPHTRHPGANPAPEAAALTWPPACLCSSPCAGAGTGAGDSGDAWPGRPVHPRCLPTPLVSRAADGLSTCKENARKSQASAPDARPFGGCRDLVSGGRGSVTREDQPGDGGLAARAFADRSAGPPASGEGRCGQPRPLLASTRARGVPENRVRSARAVTPVRLCLGRQDSTLPVTPAGHHGATAPPGGSLSRGAVTAGDSEKRD